MIFWNKFILSKKKLKSLSLPVVKWFWYKNFSKSAKSKAKRSSFSHNSLICFNSLKSTWNPVITSTKESTAKLRLKKDKLLLTDTIIHTKRETYFCCQQKPVVWVLTWPAPMWLSFMTQTGTLKTTSKLQPEPIELVKKVKSWYIDLSLAILTKQKCSKEPHRNLVSTRLFSWAVHSSKLERELLLDKTRWVRRKWKFCWKRVFSDFWKTLKKMRRKRRSSFSTKMSTKLLRPTQESPSTQWSTVHVHSQSRDSSAKTQTINWKSTIPTFGTLFLKMCKATPSNCWKRLRTHKITEPPTTKRNSWLQHHNWWLLLLKTSCHWLVSTLTMRLT